MRCVCPHVTISSPLPPRANRLHHGEDPAQVEAEAGKRRAVHPRAEEVIPSAPHHHFEHGGRGPEPTPVRRGGGGGGVR